MLLDVLFDFVKLDRLVADFDCFNLGFQLFLLLLEPFEVFNVVPFVEWLLLLEFYKKLFPLFLVFGSFLFVLLSVVCTLLHPFHHLPFSLLNSEILFNFSLFLLFFPACLDFTQLPQTHFPLFFVIVQFVQELFNFGLFLWIVAVQSNLFLSNLLVMPQ